MDQFQIPTKSPREFLKSAPDLLPKYCERCGARHDESDLDEVNSDQKKATFKLQCKSCGSTYLFHVSSPMAGVLSSKKMPFKPAITTSELKKFSKSDRINEDEVLDIYSSMKQVATIEDFNKLFVN